MDLVRLGLQKVTSNRSVFLIRLVLPCPSRASSGCEGISARTPYSVCGLGGLVGGGNGGGRGGFFYCPPSREKNISRGLSERVRGYEGRKEEVFDLFFCLNFYYPVGRIYPPS